MSTRAPTAARIAAEALTRPWDKAKVAFEQARAADAAAEVASDTAWQLAHAEVPIPPDIAQGDGDIFMPYEIDKLTDIPVSVRNHMKAVYETFTEARDAALERHNYSRLADESEAIGEAYQDAYRAVLETPAPDAAALFYKLSLIWRSDELDNPAIVQDVLTRRHDVRLLQKVHVYRDAARLAGIDLPTAEIEPWNAAAFGQGFVAIYNGEWGCNGNLGWAAPDERDPSHVMWAALADWQKKAVREWLKDQPCPPAVARMEQRVRDRCYHGVDPRDAVRNEGRHESAGTTKAVLERVGDLIERYDQYCAACGEWIADYRAAGGGFTRRKISVVPDGTVMFEAPAGTKAAEMLAKINGGLRLGVVHEAKRLMDKRGLDVLAAFTPEELA